VASHTDFIGRTTTLSFDSVNRPLGKAYPDGSQVSFTYTATGRRATAIDAQGTTNYSYDQRDRLLQQRNPDGQTLAYTYDAHGNRASVTTAAGANTYTYDATNRLSTVTDPRAGTQAIARARTEARTKVEEAERTNPGCEGNILYHYTGQSAAESIDAEQNMWLTRQWTDPATGSIFPRGVYATDIPPWAEMTQAALAKVFYFSARRQAIADLSWVVVICNDVPPPFVPLGAGQWVKPDGNVHVIAILPNPMP
jgi:YD repeat-containing protein